jgi:hypothetical protein
MRMAPSPLPTLRNRAFFSITCAVEASAVVPIAISLSEHPSYLPSAEFHALGAGVMGWSLLPVPGTVSTQSILLGAGESVHNSSRSAVLGHL